MQINFDVCLNIQKRKELVLYKTSTLRSNINLAYVISEEINSKDNIQITDQSNAIPANHIPEEITIREFSAKTYFTPVNKFKLTDVFTTETPSQKSIPLFYIHRIKATVTPTSTIHNIQILNLDFVPVELTQVVIDGNAIYNNLETENDISTGAYNTYFVRYSVTTNNIVNTYTEILDNELVYKLASYDEIGSDGLLIPTSKVYLIDEYSSNIYQIMLPALKRYAIQEQPTSRIKLIHPAPSTTDNPWFVRATNGNFITSLPVDNDWSMFKYNVPEFNSQAFQPYPPYKFANAEQSIVVNSHIIKTIKDNIVVDSGRNMFVQVVVYAENGDLKAVYSNDPEKIGTTYNGLVTISTGIRSVGRSSGYIDLQETLSETDYVEVFYFYEENEYEILDVDFNPVDNPDIVNKRVVFYLIPNTNNERNKTIYYLLVDYNGLIKDYNQKDDILPNLIDTSFEDFINNYTVQSTNPSASSNTKYLILGDVYLVENSDDQSSTIIDIRKAGGGIRQDRNIIKELIKSYPEVIWTSGVTKWNGIPFPGNGATLIEVPSSIQKNNGGLFSDITIRSIIERHLACGVYPIIRAYGCTDIKPLTVIPSSQSIQITWPLFGEEHEYNVYYSTNQDNNFVKANNSLIQENTNQGYNSYTISGLSSATIYWFYIVCGAPNHTGTGSIVGVSPASTTIKVYKTKVRTANAIV